MPDALALSWRQYRLERRMFWRNPTAAFFNSSFSLSRLPNELLIASAIAPVGAPPAFGPMISQNIEWLRWPPPLLRTAVRTASGTLAMPFTRSSRLFDASSGAFSIAAFRFVT